MDNDFDIELHKAIAKAIGGRVELDCDGWQYIDERGKSKNYNTRHTTEDSAWCSSDEDWTRGGFGIELLFNGYYENGVGGIDSFLEWLLDKHTSSPSDKCRLFLEYKSEQGE